MTGCWQRGEGVMISCAAPGLDKGAPPAGRSLDSAHDVGRLTQADPEPGPTMVTREGRVLRHVRRIEGKTNRCKEERTHSFRLFFSPCSDIKTAMQTIIIMTLQDHILMNDVIH